MTGYLHAIIVHTRPYGPAVPRLAALLRETQTQHVVDLCSGAGGPWPTLHGELAAAGAVVEITCTDLAPNQAAATQLGASPSVRYHATSVSALAVPSTMVGARTMFTALHHFDAAEVRAILADAQAAGVPFGAFEATNRSWRGLLATVVIPVAVLALMPLVRPRHWGALALTYLPPLLPLAIWWDGLASTMRTYQAAELQRIVTSLPTAPYVWEISELAGGPLPVLALIGRPRAAAA